MQRKVYQRAYSSGILRLVRFLGGRELPRWDPFRGQFLPRHPRSCWADSTICTRTPSAECSADRLQRQSRGDLGTEPTVWLYLTHDTPWYDALDPPNTSSGGSAAWIAVGESSG